MDGRKCFTCYHLKHLKRYSQWDPDMPGFIAITDSSLTYLKCSWYLSLYIRMCLSFLSKSLPWPSSKSHFWCKTPYCPKLPFSLVQLFSTAVLHTFHVYFKRFCKSVLLQQSAFPDLKSAGVWTRSFLGCPCPYSTINLTIQNHMKTQSKILLHIIWYYSEQFDVPSLYS